MQRPNHYAIATTITMLLAASTGCSYTPEENVDQVASAQFDPGMKDFSIYRLTIESQILSEMLATATDIERYSEFNEHWRFNEDGLDDLEDAEELTISATQYNNAADPVATLFPPSGSAYASNDLVVPTNVSYQTLQNDAERVFEMDHEDGFRVRIAFDVTIDSNGQAAGEMSFYHNSPSHSGYLLEPSGSYTLDAVDQPDWSDSNWREYQFDGR